jgi:ribonuclease HI
MFYDGSWRTFGAGAAAILISPSKIKTCCVARLEFNCINNIAEYEDLLLGLWKLKAMGIRREILKIDSLVITCHVDKSSRARDPKLEKYLDTVRRMEASFEGFSVKNKATQSLKIKDLRLSKHYLHIGIILIKRRSRKSRIHYLIRKKEYERINMKIGSY